MYHELWTTWKDQSTAIRRVGEDEGLAIMEDAEKDPRVERATLYLCNPNRQPVAHVDKRPVHA